MKRGQGCPCTPSGGRRAAFVLAFAALVVLPAVPTPSSVPAAAPAAAQAAPRVRPRARISRLPRSRSEPLPSTPVLRAYVERVVLVLDGTRRTMRWVEMHPANEDLARFALPLAEQYVALAGRTTPPTELRVAHPHLLLVAENAERAIASLARSDGAAFRRHLRTMREELRTLLAILEHYGVALPEITW